MKTINDFRLGDSVGVLNETLTGHIIEIRPGNITIESDDGFHYDYHPRELVLRKDLGEMILSKPYEKIDEQNDNAPLKKKVNPASESSEVDLHIHELIESEAGMSSYDKLSLQVNTARRKLEVAISKKQKKLILIHGKGDGVLRNEVRSMLKDYPVAFHDASYAKYGLGATEVIIFQNKKTAGI